MPTRGYRKGVSKPKLTKPRQIYTRVTEDDHIALANEAASRSITASDLTRAILTAHIHAQRVSLPHFRPNPQLMAALSRIGNNLNQIARQANTEMVPVAAATINRALAEVLEAMDRVAPSAR
ncbi:plasmid mobilization relaxosome protein MobC [Hyphomicrobium sp. CS1BSMeth3]|uniref:plasmid mobilization relaxosome protein MobC n=1 Tax=Hyphomicrobium sp. CS1BSMeth3 TaxID=1892844 RepID=UPI000930DED2|nr:plasmid mobilization relaxosome protein MobC [Hyphomicrobium sp. CS1BSMeth3]